MGFILTFGFRFLKLIFLKVVCASGKGTGERVGSGGLLGSASQTHLTEEVSAVESRCCLYCFPENFADRELLNLSSCLSLSQCLGDVPPFCIQLGPLLLLFAMGITFPLITFPLIAHVRLIIPVTEMVTGWTQ